MPNETYTLNYTAEQINHRLDLINENKNLLPYPYKYTTLQLSLEDVGDGSLLTTGEATVEEEIFLNGCSLLAGTYKYSTEVTDIIDTLGPVDNPGFDLKVKIDGAEQTGTFTLTEEKSVRIYLAVPENCTTKNLLIKPMIREATKEAGWVPYMGTIDKYVDERFNSTNTKLRDVLAFMKLVEIEDT